MAAASYHPRILSPKYGQTGNVRPLTAKRSLSFEENDQTLILRSLIMKSTKKEQESGQLCPRLAWNTGSLWFLIILVYSNLKPLVRYLCSVRRRIVINF